MLKSRENLIRVFLDTLNDLKRGYYINNSGEEVEFPHQSTLLRSSTYHPDESSVVEDIIEPFSKPVKVYVENIDSFLKAIDMKNSSSVAVLNMASGTMPGGGVINGSRSQEEDLCRRSNLVYSLYCFHGLGKSTFGKRKTSGSYPLPIYGGIFSPDVSIFKSVNYNKYDKPFITNVITVSAFIKPSIDKDGFMLKSHAIITKNKIRTIFRIAKKHKITKLVLGAFGCGAYKNPPKHVSLLFKEVLEEAEFKYSFKEVCFAILDDKYTGYHNPEGNYKPFLETFGGKK